MQIESLLDIYRKRDITNTYTKAHPRDVVKREHRLYI